MLRVENQCSSNNQFCSLAKPLFHKESEFDKSLVKQANAKLEVAIKKHETAIYQTSMRLGKTGSKLSSKFFYR